MGKKRNLLKKIIIILAVLLLALCLYCIEVVSTVVYARQSSEAANLALSTNSQDILSSPVIAPLLEILKKEEGEIAAQAVQSLIDLKLNLETGAIKEFSDRIQAPRAKVTYGINELTVVKWKELSETAQKPILEGESDEQKKQAITTLTEEVNKTILSILVKRPAPSTLRQYELIKNFIPVSL